jgi:hypothetical protein
MSRIMMTCPSTGSIVPTGHRTPEIKLGEGTGTRSFRCPVCSQIHTWEEKDAHVEQTISLAAFRSAAA